MRILILLSIALLKLSNIYASQEQKIFQLIDQKKFEEALPLLVRPTIINKMMKEIVLTEKYLNSDASFEEILKFIYNHNARYNPRKRALKIIAENNINNIEPHRYHLHAPSIVRWFNKGKPITSAGHKHYALAYASLNTSPPDLHKIIKRGWWYGDFSKLEQEKYLNDFGTKLTKKDHVRRIENLLWKKKIDDAERILDLVDKNYSQSFLAQIELIKDKSTKLFNKISKNFYTKGLIYRYLERCKNASCKKDTIIDLIKIASKNRIRSKEFWKVQNYLTRELIEDGKYNLAYQISSSCFSLDRMNKSEAEFLSGWLALRYLNKPELALEHFTHFSKIVKTPVSKARGFYWLGRTYNKIGKYEDAIESFNSASIYPYTFYGQLSLAQLGRNITLPDDKIDLSKFNSKLPKHIKYVIDVTKLVCKFGNAKLIEIYVNYCLNLARNKDELLTITQQLQNEENTYQMLLIAKYLMRKSIFIKEYAYPKPYKIKQKIETPLVYSIIRQESLFNKDDVSSAGATGLMQLMPETAIKTAKDIDIKFNATKLKNANYNIQLGSNYLKSLIDNYSGSYILAIASYNAGPHNIDKWLNIFGDPREMELYNIIDWIESIPYFETRNYVQRVLENLQLYRNLMSIDGNLETDITR